MKTNKFKPVKLLPVWLAVSAVLLIAGIILMCLLGFNYTAEEGKVKTFEVDYDVIVDLSENRADVETVSEQALKDAGISYLKKETDTGTLLSDGKKLVYTLSDKTSEEALGKAVSAAQSALDEKFPDSVFVTWRSAENKPLNESVWRGAVALICGVIVGMIYVCVRYGFAAALTGLTLGAHGAGVTLSVFAIARIPVTAGAPLLLAGVAAFAVFLLWLIYCIYLRRNAKQPGDGTLETAERVENALGDSWRTVLSVAGALGAAILILGAVAANGVRLLILPMLIPVAVAAYSTLLFGPALHVFVKRPFDRLAAKRKQRYPGKKKAEKTESQN